MRLLDRYLLRELLIPLSYCLGGFFLMWIASDLISRLGDFRTKGLTLAEMGEYYYVTAPEFLVQVLPMALLLSMLYSLTNHARHYEITAIRAAGVSLWRICLPYLALGLVISLGAFAINELWAPGSSEAAEEILERHSPAETQKTKVVAHLAFVNAREKRIWEIALYNPESSEMTRPQVFWPGDEGTRMRLIADRGVFTNGDWTFSNAALYREGGGTNSIPELLLQTNVLAMPQFSETPELVRSEIKVSRSLLLARPRRTELAITEILNYMRLHPYPSALDSAWLRTKLQGRLAAPWTSLVVVLIAIPFAAGSGRRNVFVGVASSILICFTYFVLQQLGLALGTGGHLEPWLAAWLPNMTFSAAGLWLTTRVR